MIVQSDDSVKETAGSIAPVDGGVNMVTYQIMECMKRLTGRTVKTYWIAEVKRELGLTAKAAWNRWQDAGAPNARPVKKRRSASALKHCSKDRICNPLGHNLASTIEDRAGERV